MDIVSADFTGALLALWLHRAEPTLSEFAVANLCGWDLDAVLAGLQVGLASPVCYAGRSEFALDRYVALQVVKDGGSRALSRFRRTRRG